jgi:hypothetical protein
MNAETQSYLRLFGRGYLFLPLIGIPLLVYTVSYHTGTDASGLRSVFDVFYPRLACDYEAVSSYVGYDAKAYVGAILSGIAVCTACNFIAIGNMLLFGHRKIRRHVGKAYLSKGMMAPAVIMSLTLGTVVFMMHSFWPTINGQEGGCSWLGRALPPHEFAQQFWFSLFLSGWLLCSFSQFFNMLIFHSVGLLIPANPPNSVRRLNGNDIPRHGGAND